MTQTTREIEMTAKFTAAEAAAIAAHGEGKELTGPQAAAYTRAVKKLAATSEGAFIEAEAAAETDIRTPFDGAGVNDDGSLKPSLKPVADTDDADFVNDAEAQAEAAAEVDGPDDGHDADAAPDATGEGAEDAPAAGITTHGGNVWHYLKAEGKGARPMCGAANAGVMRQSELRGRTPHTVCAKLAVTQPFVRESQIDWANPNRPLIERTDAAPAPVPAPAPKVVVPPKGEPKTTKSPKVAKKTAPAKKTVAPKTATADRFRPAAVAGWDTFLPAARGGAEIAFKSDDHKVMALICVAHMTVKPVKSMGEARSDRRNGKYCDHADHKNGK